MKKYILLIILILAILFFAFAIYNYSTIKTNAPFKDFPTHNLNNTNQQLSSQSNESKNQSSSGSLDSQNSNTNLNSPANLPSDLNQKPCGYYYGEYGVCAGYCFEGTCKSQERSCYCKK